MSFFVCGCYGNLLKDVAYISRIFLDGRAMGVDNAFKT